MGRISQRDGSDRAAIAAFNRLALLAGFRGKIAVVDRSAFLAEFRGAIGALADRFRPDFASRSRSSIVARFLPFDALRSTKKYIYRKETKTPSSFFGFSSWAGFSTLTTDFNKRHATDVESSTFMNTLQILHAILILFRLNDLPSTRKETYRKSRGKKERMNGEYYDFQLR